MAKRLRSCGPCAASKRSCDHVRPVCSRCKQLGIENLCVVLEDRRSLRKGSEVPRASGIATADYASYHLGIPKNFNGFQSDSNSCSTTPFDESFHDSAVMDIHSNGKAEGGVHSADHLNELGQGSVYPSSESFHIPSVSDVLNAVFNSGVTGQYMIYNCIPAIPYKSYFDERKRVGRDFENLYLRLGLKSSRSNFVHPFIDQRTMLRHLDHAFKKAIDHGTKVHEVPFHFRTEDKILVLDNSDARFVPVGPTSSFLDLPSSEKRLDDGIQSKSDETLCSSHEKLVHAHYSTPVPSDESAVVKDINHAIDHALSVAVDIFLKEEQSNGSIQESVSKRGDGQFSRGDFTLSSSASSSVASSSPAGPHPHASGNPSAPDLTLPSLDAAGGNSLKHTAVDAASLHQRGTPSLPDRPKLSPLTRQMIEVFEMAADAARSEGLCQHTQYSAIAHSSSPVLQLLYDDVSVDSFQAAGNGVLMSSVRHCFTNSAMADFLGVRNVPRNKVIHLLPGTSMATFILHPHDLLSHRLALIEAVMAHELHFQHSAAVRFPRGDFRVDLLMQLSYHPSGCLKTLSITFQNMEKEPVQEDLKYVLPLISRMAPSLEIIRTKDGELIMRFVESNLMMKLREEPAFVKMQRNVREMSGGATVVVSALTKELYQALDATSKRPPSTANRNASLDSHGLNTGSRAPSCSLGHDSHEENASSLRGSTSLSEAPVHPALSPAAAMGFCQAHSPHGKTLRPSLARLNRVLTSHMLQMVHSLDEKIASLDHLDLSSLSSDGVLGLSYKYIEVPMTSLEIIFMPWFRALRQVLSLTPEQRQALVRRSAYVPEPGHVQVAVDTATSGETAGSSASGSLELTDHGRARMLERSLCFSPPTSMSEVDGELPPPAGAVPQGPAVKREGQVPGSEPSVESVNGAGALPRKRRGRRTKAELDEMRRQQLQEFEDLGAPVGTRSGGRAKVARTVDVDNNNLSLLSPTGGFIGLVGGGNGGNGGLHMPPGLVSPLHLRSLEREEDPFKYAPLAFSRNASMGAAQDDDASSSTHTASVTATSGTPQFPAISDNDSVVSFLDNYDIFSADEFTRSAGGLLFTGIAYGTSSENPQLNSSHLWSKGIHPDFDVESDLEPELNSLITGKTTAVFPYVD